MSNHIPVNHPVRDVDQTSSPKHLFPESLNRGHASHQNVGDMPWI